MFCPVHSEIGYSIIAEPVSTFCQFLVSTEQKYMTSWAAFATYVFGDSAKAAVIEWKEQKKGDTDVSPLVGTTGLEPVTPCL